MLRVNQKIRRKLCFKSPLPPLIKWKLPKFTIKADFSMGTCMISDTHNLNREKFYDQVKTFYAYPDHSKWVSFGSISFDSS